MKSVESQVRQKVQEQVHFKIKRKGYSHILKQVSRLDWYQIKYGVWEEIWDKVGEQVRKQIREDFKSETSQI